MLYIIHNVNQIKETIIKIFELYKRNELPQVEDDLLEKYRRDNLTDQLTKQFNKLLGSKVV